MQALVLATFFLTVAVLPFDDTALAQTEPPPPGSVDPAGKLSKELPTNYAIQAAENKKDTVIQNVEAMLIDNFRQYNETYVGLHTFGGADIIEQLLENILQLLCKWLSEAQAFILAGVVCMSFISHRRRRRRLPHLGIELICIMILFGVAFERSWQPSSVNLNSYRGL